VVPHHAATTKCCRSARERAASRFRPAPGAALKTGRPLKDSNGRAEHVLSAFCGDLQTVLGHEASRGTPQREVVHLISSLSAASPQALLASNRNHWGIEIMHRNKDVAHGVAMGNAAILAHLMRTLVETGTLAEEQIFQLLAEAELSLQRLQTDAAASAVGHIQSMRKAFTEASPASQAIASVEMNSFIPRFISAFEMRCLLDRRRGFCSTRFLDCMSGNTSFGFLDLDLLLMSGLIQSGISC
jgi:hypothetical protein